MEFGTVDSINLDGGGSTTMLVRDKVVNRPSDQTGERPVSDAILVFPGQSEKINGGRLLMHMINSRCYSYETVRG